MNTRKTLPFGFLAMAFLTIAATPQKPIAVKTVPVSAAPKSVNTGTSLKLPIAKGKPGATVPKLALMGAESKVVQKKKYSVTSFTIENWKEFKPELFVPAPELPACGKNTNSSRTWLSIHRQDTGAYIYGYCALTGPAGLKDFSYSTPDGTLPPTEVFVRLTDRKTNTTYQSNCINAWSGAECGKP